MLDHRPLPSSGLAPAPPLVPGVEIRGYAVAGSGTLLTEAALAFVARLERTFRARRRELLARRERLKLELDAGWRPDFLDATRAVRSGDWRVAPIPADLLDRRVEITGPVERKM